MLRKMKARGIIALTLICALVVTVFAPIASADEGVPTMPDLSGYAYITIDEIEPQTIVGDFRDDIICSDTEEVQIYDTEGYVLSNNDYVCNGATITVSENDVISEVYKVRIYGDVNCDGNINATDLVNIKHILLNIREPFDDTVADINADGQYNIFDLIRLKKQQLDISKIEQKRMASYSTRFKWLNNIEVPYSVYGYEEVFEDFSVASNDIDLTFNRYYDSNNESCNMLSEGWSISFEGSCTVTDNGAIVKLYSSATIAFKLVNGKYVCEYSRAKLTETDSGFVFIAEDGLTYNFNQNGYLVLITDKNGNTVNIEVNPNGKIQKVTDSVGREYNYTYNENGLLASITDCIGRTVSFSYDSQNKLSSVTGVLGTVTEQYGYNLNNKLAKVADAFGNALSQITYKENSGIVSSVTDSDSLTTDYVYNADYNSVTLLQNDKVIEECIYNRYNLLTVMNTEEGIQRNFYANSYGDVAVAENADESIVKYAYDESGNPIKIITVSDGEAVTENNIYDSCGNLLSTSTESEKTLYTYDDKGNVLSLTKTDGEVSETTEYTYKDNGLVHTTITEGVTTTYCYDNNGYLSGEIDTTGREKTYIYNTIGWLETETEAETTVSYKYNLGGDTLRETKNNIVVNRTVYDNYGRIKQQISEAEYNSAYDLLSTQQPIDDYLNNSAEVPVGVRYYYGDNGKLAQIKASCYTVNTDANQKVTGVIAGNTVLAQYDYTTDAKELLSKIDYANGQSVAYNYDTNGNVVSLYYSNTPAYTYTYDTEGTLTSKINLTESIRTDYTKNNITVSKINSDGTFTEIYSYCSEKLVEADGEEFIPAIDDEEPDLEMITEKFNNQTFVTDYYENSVKYGNISYDITKNDEDIVTKTEIKKDSEMLLNSSYEYNENGLPSRLTLFYYEDVKNIYDYTYDEKGNIQSVTKTIGIIYELEPFELPPVGYDEGFITDAVYKKQYYYDNLGQLIRVDDQEINKTVVYEYNATSGNITSVKTYPYTVGEVVNITPTATVTYSYSDTNWSDLLTSYNGNALTYDALGNLTSYKGYTYSWEAGRHLAQITNGENTYSYKYDDNGIRTQKTVNGVTTYYTTVDGRITGQYDGTNTIYFRYNAGNSLIGFNLNGAEYTYLKNVQGDIEGILDQNGTPIVQYTDDVWGKTLTVTGSKAKTVGLINPMRYRDYYLDTETGYYYLQSRYYNPEFCRFINADEPVYLGAGITTSSCCNLISYCSNNPINFVDLTGHYVSSLSLSAYYISVLSNVLSGMITSISTSITAVKAAMLSSWLPAICIAATAVAIVGITYIVKKVSYLMASAAATISAVKSRVKSGGVNPNKLSNYTVYVIVRKDTVDVVYVGITKRYTSRKSAHSKRFPKNKYTMLPIATGLTKSQARAMEQTIITAYGIDTLKNLINSISPKKWNNFKLEFEQMQFLIQSWKDPE